MPVIAQLETDAWKLEIVGQFPDIPPFLSLAPNTHIAVRGAGLLSRFNQGAKKLESVASRALIEPLLFENTDYHFYLTTTNGTAELHLPPAATRHHQVGNMTHYSLNFRNDVGFVDVVVESDVTGTTGARFEVFPIKIDYRVDYVRLRDEVAAITRNLVMTAQARTFGAASAAPLSDPTLVEWLALARRYFRELVAAANAIARHPHSRLVKTVKDVAVRSSRKVDDKALSRLLRKPIPRVGATLPNGFAVPEQVPGITGRVTFDTPENRYIKALLLATRRNIQRVISTTTTGDEDADFTAEEKFFAAARPEARAMLRQIQVLLNAPFLRAVATTPPARPSSMVLHYHPHYAAFERVARLLNGGLALDGGLLQVGVKDIALLYEYWCFLKLAWLLSHRFDLVQQNMVRVRHATITVTLAKGLEAGITYRDRQTGQELRLLYNRFFNRLPTVGQRPDNVIQIASDTNLYIFDAKYRLAFGLPYQKQFGGIGPTVEDISTMHRYRDAIVLPDPTKRGKYRAGIVRGAIVLFPYPDEAAYRAHKFYESVASVDIGGLPFLPTVTTLVEEKLREVLASNGFWDQPRGEALGDETISEARVNPHNGGGGCARRSL